MIGIYKIGEIIANRKPSTNADNMNDLIWFFVHILIEISLSILFMKFAKYLVVILLSPLLAHLSERTERILTGTKHLYDFKQFVLDVKRGIRIAIRNFMWEYFLFLIIFLISMIGWKDPKSAPIFYLTFIIGFFYYGFSFIDYVNERRKLNVDESVIFIRERRGLAIAIGGVFSFLILVPVDLSVLFSFSGFQIHGFLYALGQYVVHFILWIAASASPILAIVASTIAMNDIVDLKIRPNIYTENTENQ